LSLLEKIALYYCDLTQRRQLPKHLSNGKAAKWIAHEHDE
jgi:hypothetical protein